ncbi:hypothetical protein diail_4942 [Diaporthe ilicicola]|nr:hypothetical protein diail_4942 [Diaporthe ilicicola]
MSGLFDQVLFHEYRSLAQFVKSYEPNCRVTKQSVSNCKNRPVVFRVLPVTEETEAFVSLVKTAFPRFDPEDLYALSGTYFKYKKIVLRAPIPGHYYHGPCEDGQNLERTDSPWEKTWIQE